MTDDRDPRRARTVFIRREGASQHWLDGQRREKIGRNPGAVNLLRLAAPGQHIVETINRGRHRRQTLETAVLTAPVIELRDGYFDERLFRRRVALPRDDQPILIPERQRPQKRRVGYAEYARVRADPQSQRERGDEGETFMLEQHSHAETQVLPECLHIFLQEQMSDVRCQMSV